MPRSLMGLCPEHSVAVNIPLNLVQEDWYSPHMRQYGAQELLAIFNQGLKLDIGDLYNFDNNSPHMDYDPHFIKR